MNKNVSCDNPVPDILKKKIHDTSGNLKNNKNSGVITRQYYWWPAPESSGKATFYNQSTKHNSHPTLWLVLLLFPLRGSLLPSDLSVTTVFPDSSLCIKFRKDHPI